MGWPPFLDAYRTRCQAPARHLTLRGRPPDGIDSNLPCHIPPGPRTTYMASDAPAEPVQAWTGGVTGIVVGSRAVASDSASGRGASRSRGRPSRHRGLGDLKVRHRPRQVNATTATAPVPGTSAPLRRSADALDVMFVARTRSRMSGSCHLARGYLVLRHDGDRVVALNSRATTARQLSRSKGGNRDELERSHRRGTADHRTPAERPTKRPINTGSRSAENCSDMDPHEARLW
jgi:hypothetical protein